MTVLELYKALDQRYPKSLSCSWDNDGLMVCPHPDREVKRVLLALDATDATLEEAARIGADVLITHHPLLFRPVASVSPTDLAGGRVLMALMGGVAVFSFHTRLDAAEGGVNDALAEALGLTVTGTFGDEEAPALGRLAELAMPVAPEDFARRVKMALGAPAVWMTGKRPVRRIALVGGDGKDFIRPAIEAGADTLLTGNASYNTALDAPELGLNVVEAGHYFTEAPVLRSLAALLQTWTSAACTVAVSNRTDVF